MSLPAIVLTAFDLDAYLARVGYAGPREPTLAVLRALHALHPAAIAFENLSPLMGAPVSLALPDIQAKLVRGGRGGYCYEQNGLFKAALRAIGFEVQGLAGRVRWGLAVDAPQRPRTHMALLVDLPEGRYVADVGFGGMVLTAPLSLDAVGRAQETPNDRFRLAEVSADLEVQAEVGDDWRALFRFDLTPQLEVDYEPMNWFTATHPTSPFISTLIAARTLPDRRLALLGTRFTIRRTGQLPEERTLGSLEALAQVLTDDFGLTLPVGFAAVGPKLGF